MLISRILSALVMLIVFLSSMFLFSGRYFSFVIYISSLLALYEWSKLLYFKSHEKMIFLVISMALIYYIDQQLNSEDSRLILLMASVFWLCIAPLFLIFKINLKNFFLSSFVGWILVMPLIISLNDLIELGPWIVRSEEHTSELQSH